MGKLNNVNMAGLEKVIAEAREEPQKAKRTQVITGEWLFAPDGPQFRAEIAFEGGKVALEADQPTALGGGGTRPGPMHYCFYGLAACYSAMFVTSASLMGLKIDELSARVEADMDFSRVFGLSEAPIAHEVRITVRVKSQAPEEKLREAETLAIARCPAVFLLTTPLKLEPRLEVIAG